MVKLSHIDDFFSDEGAKPQGAEPGHSVDVASEDNLSDTAEKQAKLVSSRDRSAALNARRADGSSSTKMKSGDTLSAEQEAEFHGLDEKQPFGAGHAILIACAVIVVAIAIVYIVNSWIHFI